MTEYTDEQLEELRRRYRVGEPFTEEIEQKLRGTTSPGQWIDMVRERQRSMHNERMDKLPGATIARYRRGDEFSFDEEEDLRRNTSSGEWHSAVAARAEARRPKIVPGKSDVELAQEYRQKMLELVEPVMALANEARSKGLIIGYTFGPVDAFGRISIASVEVTKKLA